MVRDELVIRRKFGSICVQCQFLCEVMKMFVEDDMEEMRHDEQDDPNVGSTTISEHSDDKGANLGRKVISNLFSFLSLLCFYFWGFDALVSTVNS